MAERDDSRKSTSAGTGVDIPLDRIAMRVLDPDEIESDIFDHAAGEKGLGPGQRHDQLDLDGEIETDEAMGNMDAETRRADIARMHDIEALATHHLYFDGRDTQRYDALGWVAVGASSAAICVSIWSACLWRRLTGRDRLRQIGVRVALPVVATFCLYSAGWLARANAKTREIASRWSDLHPNLRVAIGTARLADSDFVITEISRSSTDYDRMGLRRVSSSLRYEQTDGWGHAVDLRTRGRSEFRNHGLRYAPPRRNGGSSPRLAAALLTIPMRAENSSIGHRECGPDHEGRHGFEMKSRRDRSASARLRVGMAIGDSRHRMVDPCAHESAALRGVSALMILTDPLIVERGEHIRHIPIGADDARDPAIRLNLSS